MGFNANTPPQVGTKYGDQNNADQKWHYENKCAKPSIVLRPMLSGLNEILYDFVSIRARKYALTIIIIATHYQLEKHKAQTMTNQELADSGNSETIYSGAWGSSITIGFGSATFMWIFAWLLHMPGMHVPSAVAIPILMAPLFLITFKWVKDTGPANPLKVGLLSGFFAGLINLLILGSNIVEQPESTAQMSEQANTLSSNAPLIVLGSLGLSMLVGLVAGGLAKKNNTTPSPATTWRSRFAWITAFTLSLIHI